MTNPSAPSSPSVGRLTGFVLGLVVVVCLALIVFAAYLKSQLDHFELILAAPADAVDAAAHLAAENQAQFWAMLLTLVCWCSLIIAAALTAGIYLTIRDRNSAPLRALAQSVKNMARGDLRTGIWGMERRDSIGELARAVDMARYQFSQMPDMTLLSEQGPVRLKFEGNTRSMFEAMMRVISRDSEQVHEQTTALNEAITKQQETLSLIVSRVEAVLQNVEKRAVNGDQQVRQALQGMLASAQGLKNSQEHAADQLNRIVPYLQDRARGLSEITQLTGKQVAQVLQSLILTERGLRGTATQGDNAIRKLSTTADNLSERLFGAVNLLQASGKVLAETTEKTQSRLDEAIESLKTAAPSSPLPSDIEGSSAYIDDISPRIGEVVAALESTQAKMENLLAEQTQATKAQIDLLAVQSSGLLTQTASASQTLSTAADKLRDEQARFDDAIGQFAARMNDVGSRLEQQAGAASSSPASGSTGVSEEIRHQLQELSAQMGLITFKIAAMGTPHDAPTEPAFVNTLLREIKTGFEVMGKNLERAREQMTALSIAAKGQPDSGMAGTDLSGQMRDQWYQMAAQIEATRSGLAGMITEEVSRIEGRLMELNAPTSGVEPDALRDTQQQMEQQTHILSELVATLGVLDAHMQEIRSQVAEIKRAG